MVEERETTPDENISRTRTRAKRKLTRRKLHTENTLNAYEQRIRSLHQTDLQELEGVWLSTYDIWDTIPSGKIQEEFLTRQHTKLDNNAFRLFLVAKERGVNPMGLTSERQTGGIYIAEIPVEGGRSVSNVKFVGLHNSFTGRSTSKFSILPHDKRYYSKEEDGEI